MNGYDVLKYGATGVAAPDMSAYDKLRALAMAGGKYPVSTITGVPPISFKSDGSPLSAWTIAGNSRQDGSDAPEYVGVLTKNMLTLPSSNTIYGITFTVNTLEGTVTANGENQYEGSVVFNMRVPADVYGDFYLSGCPTGGGNNTYNIIAYDRTAGARCKKWDGTTVSENDNGQGNVEIKIVQGHTIDIQLRIGTDYDPDNIIFYPMIRIPTASADFEPYGHKIPVTCAGQTTSIYIGDPLRKAIDGSDAVDILYSNGSITRAVDADGNALETPTTQIIDAPPEIQTVRGSNTLTFDTTVQPSSVSITGHIKSV